MQNIDLLEQFSQLTDFQKDQLKRKIHDFIQFNQFVQNTHYSVCPVCGVSEPRIIKKGFLGGKQRVLCKECGRKFVTTCGRLNYNSQQSEASWSIVIVDTLNAIPLHETAAEMDCAVDTVFHMRHKFLLLLEQVLFEQGEVMEGIVEIDETYLPDSFKGIKRTEGRKARKHGEPAEKRGLSDEKMCVFMGTNRMGKEVAQCVNRARPSSQEVIEVFGDVIKEKSMLINDGLFSNYERIKRNQLTSMIVSDHHEFTDVLHLNTVNTMHSGFKTRYRFYRGVSSKYLNRYLALDVFMRRFTGMDNQEKLMGFLQKTKGFMISLTNKSVKTQNLLMI
jgi:transposase-like protein